MNIHPLLDKFISLVGSALSAGKGKKNLSKIISKLESGLAREMRNYSKEKQSLLLKAVSLEKRFLRKEFGKPEYYELKAAVHKKMLLLDLQTSIAENCFSIIENASKLTTIKADGKPGKEGELLNLAGKHIDEFREAKKLFSSNKTTVGQMQEQLKAINSGIVDVEHALFVFCTEAKRKEQARAIIEETVEKLGKENAERDRMEEQKAARIIPVPRHESEARHIPKAHKKKRRAL